MKRVLVVEDNPVNMELACQLLEDAYEVWRAGDGLEGVELAQQRQPDLILMDLSLPRMDGWAATAALREDPRTRHIPVVALTAHAIKGDREKVLISGFDGYVSKPIEEEALFAIIERLLETGRES
ncbi:MAG: response regulator [Candidatus Xenobia bacterium]